MENLFKNRKFKIFLQWFAIVLLAAVLVVTLWQIVAGLQAIRRRGFLTAYRRHHLLAPAQPSENQSWMAFRYINMIFSLPPAYLQGQLGITDGHYPNISINSIAKQQKKTSAAVLLEVQQKTQSYLNQQAAPQSNP